MGLNREQDWKKTMIEAASYFNLVSRYLCTERLRCLAMYLHDRSTTLRQWSTRYVACTYLTVCLSLRKKKTNNQLILPTFFCKLSPYCTLPISYLFREEWELLLFFCDTNNFNFICSAVICKCTKSLEMKREIKKRHHPQKKAMNQFPKYKKKTYSVWKTARKVGAKKDL